MRYLAVALAAMALGASLAGNAAGQNVITQPDWAEKPNAESFARHYPQLATAMELSGAATVSCSVNVEGRLVDCKVVVERPAGLGFGQAAVDMAADFRMKPLTLNGKPVDGGTVRIPIRFVMPQGAPRPALPEPVSDAAAQQALRMVDAGRYVERALETYEKIAARVEGMGEDRAVAKAAADAYRKAAVAHREDIRTAYAHAVGAVYSADEMAAWTEFKLADGPDDQGQSVFDAVQKRVLKEYTRNLTTRAHDAFCAKAKCAAPADLEKVFRAGDPRDTGRIDNPQWARQPSEGDLNAARPGWATRMGVSGAVRLTCRLTDAASLRDCDVDEEAPAGLGFGMAAKSLGGLYRLSAIQQTPGYAGRKVTVRIGFLAPTTEEPFQIKPAGAAAMALARQATDATRLAHDIQVKIELALVADESSPPKGVDSKLNTLAIDTFREASQQAMSDYVDQSLANTATAWTEKQLAARVAFQATPAAKAFEDRGKEIGIAGANAQYAFNRLVVADARAAFCKDHDCDGLRLPQASSASAAPSTAKP